MGKAENPVVKSVLEYLHILEKRLKGACFFWRNNNVSVYDRTKSVYRRMPFGCIYGVPDIIGLMYGRMVGIECKSEKGTMSKAQKEFMKRMIEAGGVYILARSVKDVEKGLDIQPGN